MGKLTQIEWTDRSWNPWQGCHKVSPACKFCYMYREKARYGQNPTVVVRSKRATFDAPLKWLDPAMVFTCSWSDWFVEEADPWRGEAYEIIRRTPHLTYQILTKRPERIVSGRPLERVCWPLPSRVGNWPDPPLPNVWLGVSVESPVYLHRVDELRGIPAALRFLSLEPLLEDLGQLDLTGIGWVIVGGESGPGVRPMLPEWVRSIRDQCRAVGVPFFVKQLLEHGIKIAFDHWPSDLQVREFPMSGK